MPIQKNRIYRLTIGDRNTNEYLVIEDLKICFEVRKSASQKDMPDRCRIKVYNLSTESVRKLGGEYIAAEFQIGYEDTGLVTVCSGEVTFLHTKKDGVDRITEIDIGSSYVDLYTLDVSEVVPAGSTVEEVIERVRLSMGNVARGAYTGEALKKQVIYGYPITGAPRQTLDELSDAYQLEYRVDNRTLYVNDAGGHVGEEVDAPVISPLSGLLESPYPTSGDRRRHQKDPIKKHGIEFRCLINPTIKPGSLVVLKDTTINGVYKVDSVRFDGDTRGDEWHARVHCSEKIEQPVSASAA